MNKLLASAILSWLMIFGSTAVADEESKVPGAPHLLPEDTLIYARLDDANQLRADLAESSVGRMMNDEKLKPLATDLFSILAQEFERVSENLGVSFEEMLEIPTGQVALAILPGSVSKRSEQLIDQQGKRDESEEAIRARLALKRQQQNSFSVMLMVQADQNIDAVLTLIQRMESTVIEAGYVRRTSTAAETEIVQLLPPNAGPPEMEFFIREGTLIFCLGHGTATAVLERWTEQSDAPTLADRPDFASVMSRCIGAEATRPQITFYADVYRLFERVIKRQSMAALFWPIIEELGLSKIRGVGGSLFRGGDEFESIAHIHLLIDPPRDGLFGILRPENVDPIPPDWVPADVTSYSTLHWDFAQTYENVGKIMATFQRPDMLKQMIEEPTKQLTGASFQDDIVPNFTGRYVNCRWMEPPVRANSQAQAHAVQLVDPELAKSAMQSFLAQRPQEVSMKTINGSVVYFFSPASAEERRQRFAERRGGGRAGGGAGGGAGGLFGGRGFGRPGSGPGRSGQTSADDAANATQRSQGTRFGRPRPEPTAAELAARDKFRESMRKPEPCIAILGDWAIYSDSRQLIERVIGAHGDSVERLINVPEYDLIVSELGGKLDGEKPFYISYVKNSDYIRQMYDLAQSPDMRKLMKARSESNPASGQIANLLERDELPPFEEFELYFAPSGTFAYDEADGIHIGMFTLRAE